MSEKPLHFTDTFTPVMALFAQITELVPVAKEARAPIPDGLSEAHKRILTAHAVARLRDVADASFFIGGYATALFSARLITEDELVRARALLHVVANNPDALDPLEKTDGAVAPKDPPQQPPADVSSG